MIKENLYKPYSISFETSNDCPKLEHTHSFFELVYIRSGAGVHKLNKLKCKYIEGSLFLLTPDDTHSFKIEKITSFFFLRFNNIYLQKNNFRDENILKLEYILQNANRNPECILKNIADRTLMQPIIESLYRENTVKDIYNEEMVNQLVNTLIVIVARNIAKFLPEYVFVSQYEKVLDIVHHIQQNIYEPEKLKAAYISKVFAISTAYLGRYFKKQTQETMQNYIAKYKINLIEHRLKFSEMRMNEIALEFGFTDVSHLNKYFKNQKGISLKRNRGKLQS